MYHHKRKFVLSENNQRKRVKLIHNPLPIEKIKPAGSRKLNTISPQPSTSYINRSKKSTTIDCFFKKVKPKLNKRSNLQQDLEVDKIICSGNDIRFKNSFGVNRLKKVNSINELDLNSTPDETVCTLNHNFSLLLQYEKHQDARNNNREVDFNNLETCNDEEVDLNLIPKVNLTSKRNVQSIFSPKSSSKTDNSTFKSLTNHFSQSFKKLSLISSIEDQNCSFAPPPFATKIHNVTLKTNTQTGRSESELNQEECCEEVPYESAENSNSINKYSSFELFLKNLNYQSELEDGNAYENLDENDKSTIYELRDDLSKKSRNSLISANSIVELKSWTSEATQNISKTSSLHFFSQPNVNLNLQNEILKPSYNHDIRLSEGTKVSKVSSFEVFLSSFTDADCQNVVRSTNLSSMKSFKCGSRFENLNTERERTYPLEEFHHTSNLCNNNSEYQSSDYEKHKSSFRDETVSKSVDINLLSMNQKKSTEMQKVDLFNTKTIHSENCSYVEKHEELNDFQFPNSIICDDSSDRHDSKSLNKMNKLSSTSSTISSVKNCGIASPDNTKKQECVETFTRKEFNLLKQISCPLLEDLECLEFLKSRAELEDISHSNKENFDPHVSPPLLSKMNTESSGCFTFATSNRSKNGSQKKNTLKFSQDNSFDMKFISCNNPSVSKTFNSFSESGILSQDIYKKPNSKTGDAVDETGFEIFNFILSQDLTQSNSKLNKALNNMSKISEKSQQQRMIAFNCNQNSDKLLEVALKTYTQYKNKILLSNSQQHSISRPIRNRIEVTKYNKYKIYSLKEDIKFSIIRNYESHDYSDRNDLDQELSSDEKILNGLNQICSDDSLLFNEKTDYCYNSQCQKREISRKIEGILEKISEEFSSNRSPFLNLPRQTLEDCIFENGRLSLSQNHNKSTKIHYKRATSQPKFCLIVYMLAKVLELLETNTKLTKREIYYQIKNLVSKQIQVDCAVKAVSRLLSVGPWEFNIISHKGLVFGNLKITLSSTEVINCNIPGTSIPQDVDDIVALQSAAVFILVVEKESIFSKLLEEDLPNRLVRPFIMITGKGFPDLNTQLFIKKLWMVMSIPVFIFVDADPHGITIMATYRFGSLANAHLSHQLAIPKARWLGVFPSEILKLDAVRQPLSQNEMRMMKNILKAPYITRNPKIEEEIKIMLESGVKSNIEGIIKNNNFLSEFYFPLKFFNQDFM